MDSIEIPDEQPSEPLTGYELVADMMRRQDEVIAQIDALNDQIETVIREVSEVRKAEMEGHLGETGDDQESILKEVA